MRKIKKYDGESPEMYSVIAPLVMNHEVAKYLNRIAVTTSPEHKWYVLSDNSDVCAFAASISSNTGLTIRYIYVNDNCAKVQSLEELIKAVMDDFKESEHDTATAIVKTDDIKYWKRFGFEIVNEGKAYTDMQKVK